MFPRCFSTVTLPIRLTHGCLAQWTTNSKGGYIQTCSECQLDSSSALTLSCLCKGHSGQWTATRLNLQEHIANYNGHMLSDLAGPVQVPAESAPYPVPTDWSWEIKQGEGGCYCDPVEGIPGGPYDCNHQENLFCERDPIGGRDPTTCSVTPGANDAWGWGREPAACFTNHGYTDQPYYATFMSMKGVGVEKGYEFVMYDNVYCTGEPLGTLEAGEQNQGVCKVLPDYAAAVKVVAKWNWS